MRKRAGLIFLATVVAMAGIWAATTTTSVSAQETAARPTTGQYKIGVVDMKGVFDQYERQKQEYEQLRNERDKKQESIDALATRFEAKERELSENRHTMTEERRDALEAEINSLKRQFEADFRMLQGDIDSMEKRLLERVFRDIHAAIAEVALRDDYHLVMESGEGGRTGVVFSSPTLDITQKVVEHLNQ